MKKLLNLLPIFCLLICSTLAFYPSSAKADGIEEARAAIGGLSKNVRFYTLDNGLRVILYNRGTAPVFSGAVAVLVGGADEVPGNTGISHMLEHMAFKGTPEVGTVDYERERVLLAELEEIALATHGAREFSESQLERWQALHAELETLWVSDGFTREYDKRGSVGLNATTGKDLTRYFVSMPKTAFEFWCWMESERILRPVMRQFYQERDVVLEERRMRYEDSPTGRLYELLLGTAYLSHPYRNPVIGYESDLRGLTATMTKEFHKKFYVPSNMVVSIVGDIDVEKDFETINKYFGRIPAGPAPERPLIEEAHQRGERTIVLEDRSAPRIMISYRKPNYPHPDDPAIYLMLEMLVGSRISPMYEELVRRRQLVLGISHWEGPGFAYPNLFTFQAATRRPHSNREVIEAFDEIIEEFKSAPVDEDLLDMAKRQVAVSYLARFSSNMSLALEFASAELVYNDWIVMLKWFEEAMAVTPEEIHRVANQYLNPTTRTIGMIESEELP